ncbi:hypothetical protein B0H14DRAFT_2559800 [Mycena olivaceomarginata]|nr:hypothetical protein B0H14DRAFT_2559800 [Mycena olivaceomarginata]
MAIISIGMLTGELGPEQIVSGSTDTCTSRNTVVWGLDAKELPGTHHWCICWLFWTSGTRPEQQKDVNELSRVMPINLSGGFKEGGAKGYRTAETCWTAAAKGTWINEAVFKSAAPREGPAWVNEGVFKSAVKRETCSVHQNQINKTALNQTNFYPDNQLTD